MSVTYFDKGATVSADGRYRYRLWREWDMTRRAAACLFIMLNPSTADGSVDDPTIRRCVSFADAFGCGRLDVVNLFAFRATDPRELLAADAGGVDIVGPENSRHVQETAASAQLVICAWGAMGDLKMQNNRVAGWLGSIRLHALGMTADGHPRHPLYLKASARPIPFTVRRAA